MTPRRIVSIWFPHFAIQRWRRRHPEKAKADDDRPIVLAREAAHGPVIHDMNRAAAKLGLRREARVTDMRTLVPHLRVEDAALEKDEADLTALAHWARRWCPWTRGDGAEGLLLDTTGSDHLHGGEATMLADMTEAFARAGLTTRSACASTVGAAWALARQGGTGMRISTPESLTNDLAPLPVVALRLKPETVSLLDRLGLKTIGALAAVPREALVRRFRQIEVTEANPVRRLDQAMGCLPEPLLPVAEHQPLRAYRRMMEPVLTLEGLKHVLEVLADDLCALMNALQKGIRHLRFTGYRVDGLPVSVDAATSLPSRDPAHLTRLFDNRLEALDAGFGIEAATLDALGHEAMSGVQDRLGGEARNDLAFQQLVDCLTARLGSNAVMVPVLQSSHIPERNNVFYPATQNVTPALHPANRPGHRPLRLLRQPEEAHVTHAVPEGPPAQMVWRRLTHRIVKSEGPERIAPEWWCEKGSARFRDYYRIEDTNGRRYWVFREGLPDDGRGGAPRWFVHGIDA